MEVLGGHDDEIELEGTPGEEKRWILRAREVKGRRKGKRVSE